MKNNRKQCALKKSSALPGENSTITQAGGILPSYTPTEYRSPFPLEAGYENNCDHNLSLSTSLKVIEEQSIKKSEIVFLPQEPHVNRYLVIHCITEENNQQINLLNPKLLQSNEKIVDLEISLTEKKEVQEEISDEYEAMQIQVQESSARITELLKEIDSLKKESAAQSEEKEKSDAKI